MTTKYYYRMLQQLKIKQRQEQSWRLQVVTSLEELRKSLATALGVEHLSYHDGQRRYVELQTPFGRPFHISADDVIESMGVTSVVCARIAVALEGELGIESYFCSIRARCYGGVVEYKVVGHKTKWTSVPDTMVHDIIRDLMKQLRNEKY
ncbi:hypothetical protein ACWONS_004786 [Vibrio parahaemolyticus]